MQATGHHGILPNVFQSSWATQSQAAKQTFQTPWGHPPTRKGHGSSSVCASVLSLELLVSIFQQNAGDLKASSKPRLKLIFALAPWTKRKAYAHFMPYLSMFYLNHKSQLDPYSCNVCSFRYRFDNDCHG